MKRKKKLWKSKRRLGRCSRDNKALRFSPTAWAKLLYFRDRGESEIGGFGITAADDAELIAEFVTVRQKVSLRRAWQPWRIRARLGPFRRAVRWVCISDAD